MDPLDAFLRLQHLNIRPREGERYTPTDSRNAVIQQYSMPSSLVPPAYPPCITPLSNLSKVMITDLLLETHHRGSYILLRTIAPTHSHTMVKTIVEDEEGSVLMLQLYNPAKELSAYANITVGTVMIVREPYLGAMTDGEYAIRVDHLSDFNFIPDHDVLVPLSWRRQVTDGETSADYWKKAGNDYFNKAGYEAAIDYYSKALDCSPTVDETRTIKLNRALTYLKTHRFEAALGDLKTVSPGDKPSEKALFREIQALYHLQRFREACNVHKVLSQEYPENTLAKSEFTRAIARLAEQEEGRYQFSQMQREAKECFPPHLDHATYIGPVCVKPTESHGRGLFTTKAVKAGDLLFCEKAFAYALADPINTIEGVPGVINGLTDRMGLAVNRPLVGLIEKRLSRSPSLLSTFADLYHGSYESVGALTVDGRPIVDSFLVEHIVGLNTTFSCPVLSYEDHIHTMNTKAKPENAAKYCGVWSLFSYINHSCYSNAHPSFIGDMMIVRAAQDMPPNTEIMHGYQSSLNTVMADHKIDMKEWGFECSCVMCKDSQQTKDTDMLKRKELRVSLAKELYLHGPPKMEKIDAIFSEFAGTYSRPASEVPRLGLWCLYSVVEIQWLPHNPQKAAEWAVKTLESLGYVIEGAHLPHVPGTSLLVKQWGLMLNTHMEYWMTLAAAYRLAAPDIVAQAEEYARITYRICIGEDETFDEAYLKG